MVNANGAHEAAAEGRNRGSTLESLKVWLIPILAILFIFAFGAFVRLMVGTSDKQELDYGTKPFVPGESPYSTGEHSR